MTTDPTGVAELHDPRGTAHNAATAPGSRPAHRRARAAWSGPPDLLLLPLVLVGGCLLAWVRSPAVLLHPALWAEDGPVFFQSAYNLGWHASLIQTSAGYLGVLPRVGADLGLLVPLEQLPLFFALAALVVQVLPAVFLASRRMAHVVPDVRVRLLLAAVYLLMPNSSEINVRWVNGQWHMAVLAILIVLASPARGWWWRVFDVVALALSCLTGPFVLSLVIVAAIVLWRTRQRWTMVLTAVAAVTGALQVIALLTSHRPAHGPVGATVVRAFELLGGRMLGTTLFGSATSTSSVYLGHLLVISVAIVVVATAVVLAAVVRGPFELKMFNLWAGMALAGSLASPLVTLTGSQWQALIGNVGSRYWYFPSLAFVADLIWLAGRRGRWVRVGASAAVALLVVFAAFGVREDFRYPVVTSPNWAAAVRSFDEGPAGRPYAFPLAPSGWTMVLVKK